MRKRIELGTDIATIGIWDPTRERHDLATAKFRVFDQQLNEEARLGRLFFIETGGDGGCDCEFFLDESVPKDKLDLYSTWNQQFLILSESGRLIAGGVEDFVQPLKQITGVDSEVSIPPGNYRLTVHELQHNKLESADHLKAFLGREDFDYYTRRSSGWRWGILALIAVIVFAFLKLWIAAVFSGAVWLLYLLVQWWRHSADERLRQIDSRVEQHMDRFPQFLFVLSPLQVGSDLGGGWQKL